MIDEMAESLVNRKRIILTIDVQTKEGAEEILRWMYAKEKPMQAELVQMAWDSEVVPKKTAEALRILRETIFS